MPGLDTARCSFCQKQPAETRRLVRGPSVSICADCVRVCADVLLDREVLLDRDHVAPTSAAPAPRLGADLVAQPEAAILLERLFPDKLLPAPGTRVLLVGPSGTGKSRALRALGERQGGTGIALLDLAVPQTASALASRLDAIAPGSVLLLDALEHLCERAEARSELESALEHVGSAGGPRAVFAAFTVAAGSDGEEALLSAHVEGRSLGSRGDLSPLLARAAARGAPASLLARFSAFVPFAPLGADELRLLLASRIDALVGAKASGGYRLRLSPAATELIVERALRLGGGAWGLKAVLAATLSSLEEEAQAVAPPAPARPRKLEAIQAKEEA